MKVPTRLVKVAELELPKAVRPTVNQIPLSNPSKPPNTYQKLEKTSLKE